MNDKDLEILKDKTKEAIVLSYTKTIVVNLRKSKYDIYIGRPGKWGNPFMIVDTPTTKVVSLPARRVVIAEKEPDAHNS